MSELHGFGQRVAVTPQREQAAPNQVQNNAGGYVFELSPWDHLARFLILGTAGGTYYAGQKPHTEQAVKVMQKCLAEDGVRAVNLAVEISDAGRAIKNDQAIFLIAVASSSEDEATRKAAYAAVTKVCRTATHLFQFLGFVQEHRGWSRGLRTAVSRWFVDREPESLAYQLVKYRQRDGWTHMDALRLSHPKAASELQRVAFDFACGRQHEGESELKILEGFRKAQADDADQAALVREYRLPWEALRTPISPDAWKAMIETNALPMGALVRQLPTLTRAEVFRDQAILKRVLDNLTNQDYLTKARIHPFAVLFALTTYASGRSFMGDNAWKPVTAIVDALDEAFYLSFGNVEPMGGRTLLALDVSGSMAGARIAKSNVTARAASAAMSLVTYATEDRGAVETIGFTSGRDRRNAGGLLHGAPVSELNLSNRQRLDDVLKEITGLPFGGTDCAQPMLWAQAQGKSFDQFLIYTDSETWAGKIHPYQALRDYRKAVNPNARLVVVGMTATGFSIADPRDAGMLDVVGFDTAAPNLIADFCRGEL
jgi:60 kDa SS-A/Ro ribonucleoprotein